MLFPLIEENDDLTVFMTESCNSNCVMCPMSRDSRKRGNHCSDEAWAEALAVLHKRRYRHISITGGEPFLMAERLLSLMCTLRDTQADTPVLLLTNGRALCLPQIQAQLKELLDVHDRFGIPIHGSNAALHDAITQSPGSFAQTIAGLHFLADSPADIEIRIVCSALNQDDLSSICWMLCHSGLRITCVNFIAMEMTGSAAYHRDQIWMPYDKIYPLIEPGIFQLLSHGIDVNLYDFPLCALPQHAWPLAKRSISPWKIRYDEKCSQCAVRDACGGMFYSTYLLHLYLDISFRTNAGVVHAIRGINLDLQKGETVAIVGESGSGKSVTMKAAVGLLDSNATINSGEILYTYDDGHGQDKTVDLLKLSKKQLRTEYNGQRLAMVFQDPMTSLDPTMTIGKQIMEGMLLHKHMPKDEARTKALQLLELVGITDAEKRFRNYPHQLSGGMRQRVVIAIALSAEPDILICDEPTTALDVTIQSKILDLIKQIQQKMHLSVIYITHDLGVVAKVADYVNVMYAGKIVEVGNVEEIFYEPCHPYTWGLLSAMPDLETADDRLYSIPGSPPNLLHEPVGDAFAARNRFAMVIDKKAEPPLFKVSETHYAATWLLHPDAPAFEMPKELKERLERAKKEAAKYL